MLEKLNTHTLLSSPHSVKIISQPQIVTFKIESTTYQVVRSLTLVQQIIGPIHLLLLHGKLRNIDGLAARKIRENGF